MIIGQNTVINSNKDFTNSKRCMINDICVPLLTGLIKLGSDNFSPTILFCSILTRNKRSTLRVYLLSVYCNCPYLTLDDLRI